MKSRKQQASPVRHCKVGRDEGRAGKLGCLLTWGSSFLPSSFTLTLSPSPRAALHSYSLSKSTPALNQSVLFLSLSRPTQHFLTHLRLGRSPLSS